jgi:hypothetical protein
MPSKKSDTPIAWVNKTKKYYNVYSGGHDDSYWTNKRDANKRANHLRKANQNVFGGVGINEVYKSYKDPVYARKRGSSSSTGRKSKSRR